MAHDLKSRNPVIITIASAALLACTSLAGAQSTSGNTIKLNESPQAQAEGMPGADVPAMESLVPEEDGAVADGTEPVSPRDRGMDDSSLTAQQGTSEEGASGEGSSEEGATADAASDGDTPGETQQAQGQDGDAAGKSAQETQTEPQNNEPGSASDEELATAGSKEGDEMKQAADGDAPDCKSMLDDFRASREELRNKVAEAAKSHPLVLAMADGSFAYVGEEGELSEPLESWFVNEETAKDQEATAKKAEQLLADQKNAECADMLQQAMDSGNAKEGSEQGEPMDKSAN